MSPARARRWARRAVGTGYFLLIPALSAVAPLFALPVISAAFGVDGWASVAVGLSLGMAAGTIAELGWSVIGPQAVAGGDDSARAELYADSRATKLVSVALLAPLAGLLAGLLTVEYRIDAVLLAVAGAATALGTSWFFVGLNRPLAILAVDTIPRIAAVLLAAGVIALGGPLVVYPIALLAAALLTSVGGPMLLGYRWWPPASSWRRVPSVLRTQSPILLGRIVGTGYTSLTVTLTAVSAPAAVPLFAAYERVMRMAAAILAGIHSRLQSWLGQSRTARTRRARIRSVIVANSVLGATAGIAFALLAPLVVAFLFSGLFEAEPLVAAGSGLVLALICTARGVGLALVAVDAARSLTAAAIGSCLVGLPLLLLLPPIWGPFGAVAAEIAAEAVGLVVLALALRSRLRKRRTPAPPGAEAPPSPDGPLRIAVVADGDPSDPGTNSGVAAGLVGALDDRPDVQVVATVDATPRLGPLWLLNVLLSFHPSRDQWRRRFHKGALGARLRSRARDRGLLDAPPFDLLIHVRNTYLPPDAAHVAFIDGTTALAEAGWPEWSLGRRAAERRMRRERRQFESALRVWFESFGLSAAEAMSAGLATLLTRTVGVADEAAAMQAAVIVERNPASIATEIERLARDVDARRRLSASARAYARSHFSWAETA